MSTNIAIVTDSTADVPAKARKKYDIEVVDAYVHFGDETFTSKNLTMEEFHEKLLNASKENFPKTSQPSSQDFLEKYEELENKGVEEIVSIHIGDKLAGTLNSAKNAAELIEDANITLVNSHLTSAPLYVCLKYARKLIDEGKSPDEVKNRVESFGKDLVGYFSLKTMDNLVRGGRIGRIRYTFGRLLNIKPILVLENGKINPFDKARGIENSRNRVFELATEEWEKEDSFQYIIAHCQTESVAKEFETRIKENYPNAEGEIIEIGMAVSVHTGPGSIYLATYQFPSD